MEAVRSGPAGRWRNSPAVVSPWARGAAFVAFWALWGLLYANVIYLSMLDHGHSWWRLVLWQLVNWLTWAALTPVVLALRRRVPLEFQWRSWTSFAFHAAAGIAVSLLHLLPLAVATAALRPYDHMEPELPLLATYKASLGSWFRLDMVVYWAILAVATAWDAFRRARERERRAAELEGRLAGARLEVLRLQLEPHFLFNTLHTATSLVRQGAGDDAVRVLVRLGDLLREILERSGDQTVPLGDELALLDGYLEIQQVRFPELRVERRLDPTSLDAPVPSFILQPLVENAVEHGAAAAGGRRWVRLESRRADGCLEVTVENPAAHRAGRPGTGLGLDNCRRRLEALYGDAGQLRLETLEHPDGGTVRATLRVPVAGPVGREPSGREPAPP